MTADTTPTSPLAAKTNADAVTHQFHAHGQYPSWCSLCAADKQGDADTREADWAASLTFWLDALDTAVTDAPKYINAAQQALTRLLSNEVYDEELMGASGNDLNAELETAARALRNAARIVMGRKALLSQ